MYVYAPKESYALDERIDLVFNFERRKPSGGSLSSVTGKIKLAGGAQSNLSVAPTISSDKVTATVIGGTDYTAAGSWQVDVLVTMSNSEKVHLRVNFTAVASA